MHDVQWLLEQERETLFFTRDRARLLTRPKQREVAQALRHEIEQGLGVDLSTWAAKWDLSSDVLTKLIKREGLEMVKLEDGLRYSSEILLQARDSVVRGLKDSGDQVLNVNQLGKGLPAAWLEKICQDVIADTQNEVKGVLQQKGEEVTFTPTSAHDLLQKQEEEAMKERAIGLTQALDQVGYCDLEGVPPPTADQVLESWRSERPEQSLAQLRTSDQSHVFLILEPSLTAQKSKLGTHATQTAQQLWTSRTPGQELFFSKDKFLAALQETPASSTELALYDAILSSPSDTTTVEDAFASKITELQANAAQNLISHIRTKLLAPLALYTSGLATIQDATLNARVAEHITDLFRRTLIPDMLTTIRKDNLLPTSKPLVREIEKFDTSMKEAKTLPEINTASAKLARKLKIEQPDKAALHEAKTALLSEKVEGIRKMKRGSDLLQNTVWLLLATACGREGVFVSSGKDTSRMIKMAQGDLGDEAEVGKRLVALRDVVKEGKDGDKERSEMRNMTKDAVDTWEAS